MKKLIYFIIVYLICINTSNAQSNNSSTDKKIPVLNGHTFPSLDQFRSSFITTSLQANLGYGLTSVLKIPGIEIGDYTIFSFEGQILFFNMNVKYQQRFTPWLALFTSVKVAGRVGTDMSTIVADGVNTLSGGDIGWLVRIKQSEKLNLSGTISVMNLTGNFINVSDYFRDLVNNVPDPSVTKVVPAMSIGLGFQGAYAFNSTFGVQFNGEYAIGESFKRDKNHSYYFGGIMGDVDFLPRHNIPLGLVLGYTLTTTPEIIMRDGGTSNIFTARVGYTGSEDFELGIQYSYYNTTIQSVENKPYISKIMLSFKFYF